ncbi:MAG: FAD-dependent oxidoreductase [Antricoccus sp.]
MSTRYDIAVVGGGVMGLFTAYWAVRAGAQVVVIDASTVGDPMTASFGKSRSYRNDYLDARYAQLAHESRSLWRTVEAQTDSRLLVECGCLNIASAKVTPALDQVYGANADRVLQQIGLPRADLANEIGERWSMFDVDVALLDVEAGFVDVQAVTAMLQQQLVALGVQLIENCTVKSIVGEPDGYQIQTSNSILQTAKISITSGHGTNDVLHGLGSSLQIPITKDRPSEAKYLIPPAHRRAEFTPENFPVFAYLDVGIYGHPILDGKTPGIKVGYYNPPDVQTQHTIISDVRSFLEICMPELLSFEARDIDEVDQCDYDLVGDDQFVLGPVPGYDGVVMGVGWRGTGYKYAPWVGRTLAQLALQGGTVYDIGRFNPARFGDR